jgi:hypothetical protein
MKTAGEGGGLDAVEMPILCGLAAVRLVSVSARGYAGDTKPRGAPYFWPPSALTIRSPRGYLPASAASSIAANIVVDVP